MYKTVNNKFSRIIISFAMALFAVIFLPWGMQTASADIIYFDVTGGQLVFDSATGTIIGYTGNPTDVEIPSTIDDIKVTGIGDRAFESCGSLTSVTMPDGNPDGIKSIGFAAFNNCGNLTSVNIPYGVTGIGGYAFSLTGLSTVTVPDSVTSIGSNAFALCINLESVNLSDSLTSIPDGLFYWCLKLQNVTIPNSVTSIGGSAFNQCLALTEINIPDGVTVLPDHLFESCSNLTRVTIPDSVTYIGNYAFYGCNSLTDVNIPDGVTTIGDNAFARCYSLTGISMPDSVTSIGNGVFRDCTSLQSVRLSDSVTNIGVQLFFGCGNLTSVNIPKNAVSIEDHAFYGCSSLPGVAIPEGVTSIGGHAFENCSSLTDINIPNGITSLADYTFAGCSSLPGITIPESVASMGVHAFEGCSSLQTINIPNGVTGLAEYVFAGCSSLPGVAIPDSVTSIGNHAFDGCSSLSDIAIPAGITSIGNSAFSGCGLLSVLIPDSVTTLGDSVFSGCGSLKDAALPAGITSIESGMFYNCSSLTGIGVPDGVISIGDVAFWGCSGLTSITFPAGIKSIGDGAFHNCSGITSIYSYPDPAPSVKLYNYYAFVGVPSTSVLYIPHGAAGYDTSPWTQFQQNDLFTGSLVLTAGEGADAPTAASITVLVENTLNPSYPDVSVYYLVDPAGDQTAPDILAASQIIPQNNGKYMAEGLTADTQYVFVAAAAQEGNINKVISQVIRVSTLSSSADISGDFSDPNFKQAVWEWLGNEPNSVQGPFTRADLNARMADQNYTLNVEGKSISSLAGFENFDGTGLRVFNCRNNQIEVLPALPASLTELYCAENLLSTLPELPGNLVVLSCFSNNLAMLPVLPGSLSVLGCVDNQLENLPVLPGGLTQLRCSENKLTSLPTLPGGLVLLWCANNQLASLPVLPDSLTELLCFNNQLTELPELSNTALANLYCANNQLRSLPALPASLNVLWCFNNDLTSLPTLPPGLTELKCEQNYLNVFTGDLESMIDGCQAATKTFTPQYSSIYTGSGLTLVTGDTSQVTSGSLSLEESGDGTTWSFISAAELSDFTFNSSDSSVATVDSGGKITAVSPGNCSIYALYKNIDSEYTRAIIPVTVSEPAPVVLQGISLNSDSYSMKAGETYNIIVTANYSDGSSQDVTAQAGYKTSNRKIATVDSTGIVTGMNAGNAVITVTYNNFTAQVNIEVVKVVLTGISLDTQFCSLKTGETHSITVTANYSDGSSRIVTADAGYRTSNRKVATVNASGVIAGNKPGSALITVKYNNITAQVTVNVTS